MLSATRAQSGLQLFVHFLWAQTDYNSTLKSPCLFYIQLPVFAGSLFSYWREFMGLKCSALEEGTASALAPAREYSSDGV